MKFGQYIEYIVKNVFLERSYTKHGEEAIRRPFYERSKLNISLGHQSEML